MTDVTSAQLLGTTATPQQGARASAEQPARSSLISSDFDTFLKMLTAQVRNQDPLNPLDSTDFATQLATFSGVEQQVQTNDLLSGLGNALAAGGLADLAGWVGMQARAPVPVRFDGTSVEIEVAQQEGATRSELLVLDQQGSLRDRFNIPRDGGPVTWSGVADDGTRFANGVYSFIVVSYDANGQAISETTPEAYGTVREVRRGATGNEIVFESDAVISDSEVSALRRP